MDFYVFCLSHVVPEVRPEVRPEVGSQVSRKSSLLPSWLIIAPPAPRENSWIFCSASVVQ